MDRDDIIKSIEDNLHELKLIVDKFCDDVDKLTRE